ncbi:RNA polymerase-binding protein DksA [Thiotrichales bacterium HSG1]|nr:RNA polymerase-binding protein DksA [Thiotrichales bacterium HSG1]
MSDNTIDLNFAPYQIDGDEKYMSDSQLKHFKQILLEWKKILMIEVDKTMRHMQDEVANYPDPNDRATQEEEFSIELRTRDRERKLIKKIDTAITSIDSKEYGYCTSCESEIGVRRLEARPTATKCIDCKTLDETQEKYSN